MSSGERAVDTKALHWERPPDFKGPFCYLAVSMTMDIAGNRYPVLQVAAEEGSATGAVNKYFQLSPEQASEIGTALIEYSGRAAILTRFADEIEAAVSS